VRALDANGYRAECQGTAIYLPSHDTAPWVRTPFTLERPPPAPRGVGLAVLQPVLCDSALDALR